MWHLIFILYGQIRLILKSSLPPGWWKIANQLLLEVISISLPHQSFLASRSIYSGKVIRWLQGGLHWLSAVYSKRLPGYYWTKRHGCSNFTIHTIMRCWNLGLPIWQLISLYSYRLRSLLFPWNVARAQDWVLAPPRSANIPSSSDFPDTQLLSFISPSTYTL